jgi:DNA polymerase III epsilon subunit family exonuclease
MEIALQRSFDDLGTPLSQVTFVVVDVETTGGSPATASLTEVGAARYCGGEILGTYQTFVNPDERIPPFITALTGISDAMVADAPRVGEMLPSLFEFIGGGVLVGHNLRFDLSFLDHALVSTGRDRLANATVDTLALALARRLVRDMVPDCKLGTLAAGLRLPHQPSHRALTDVLATGDLLHDLIERAGSFGIVGLEELLDLPRLIGHPQAAKLRLTTRLPHRPGVYWFTDAAGHVLYVGKATDLQARVRSYFTGDRRRKVGRLLRQLHAIHHRVCPGPLSAAVIEGRLIRAWSPPFNQQGRARRSPLPRTSLADTAGRSPRRRKRGAWTAEELGGEPSVLLAPLAVTVVDLSSRQRFEEAASARDEGERVRRLVIRHRRVESVRQAGRMVLSIDGEGEVVLDGGLMVEHGTPAVGAVPGGGGSRDSGSRDSGSRDSGSRDRVVDKPGADASLPLAGDGHDLERIIVAQWLEAHSERVRIVEVGSPTGLGMPADRVPRLAEVCAAIGVGGELAEPGECDDDRRNVGVGHL